MKKAQGMSLNVIVIAALALIVLVVLVAIFTGRMGLFTQSLREQESKFCGPVTDNSKGTSINGRVTQLSTGCLDTEVQIYGVFKDVAVNQICCLPK